ncbi:MAG: zinc-binding dehydrogenase [Rhodobacteraceae bacterium]|nr:zinc-binding dehydrogenase [Paracoccaceae bacterium]
MRAAVCREHGKPLSIETVRLAPPGRGQVEVVIEACAICHSDIHYIDGAWKGVLPAVYGHEAAGRIVRIGEGVGDRRVGERVLVTLLRHCGECVNCGRGLTARCEVPSNPQNSPFKLADGSPLAQGLGTGCFAERTVVDQTQIAPIPQSMPADTACLLSCGVITGVGAAVNTAEIEPGATVAVVGAGGVGLNAIQGARIRGASKVIAVDISEQKLADARFFGATDTVLAAGKSTHKEIRRLTGGRGVDYALVTVGAVEAMASALRFICQGGALVIVGMPPSGVELNFEPVILAHQSQRMLGSSMGDTDLSKDIPWLLKLHAEGRLKVDELVTGRYSLDQINEAIENTVDGKARRNVILF